MKITTLLIFVCGIVAFPNFSYARVGETEQQTDHRYGKPVGKWDDYVGYKKLYHWHSFDVMVTFMDGVSQREMFNRAEGIDPGVKKYLRKISEVGKNGIITTGDSMTFTTKEFGDKYDAARAAWEKSHDQKQQPDSN